MGYLSKSWHHSRRTSLSIEFLPMISISKSTGFSTSNIILGAISHFFPNPPFSDGLYDILGTRVLIKEFQVHIDCDCHEGTASLTITTSITFARVPQMSMSIAVVERESITCSNTGMVVAETAIICVDSNNHPK